MACSVCSFVREEMTAVFNLWTKESATDVRPEDDSPTSDTKVVLVLWFSCFCFPI